MSYMWPKLNRSARGKAGDVMRCQTLSHSACGRPGFFWARRLGILEQCGRASENLAFGSGGGGTPRQMMSRWLKSPSHRSNLMAPGNIWIGVAVVKGRFLGNARTAVWTTHFGSACG